LPQVALLMVKHGMHETAVIRASLMHGRHVTFGCVGGQKPGGHVTGCTVGHGKHE
jgi:hypothetical protein